MVPGALRYTKIAEVVGPVFKGMCDRAAKKTTLVGLPTGLNELDAVIGGLQPGKLYVVAGRPGHGKSTLAGNMVSAAAIPNAAEGGNVRDGNGVMRLRDPTPVIRFDLEMTKAEATKRQMLSELQRGIRHTPGLPRRLKTGALIQGEGEPLSEAGRRVHAAPIALKDDVMTMTDIASKARRWRRGRDCGANSPALAVIDYAQICAIEKSLARVSREQQVAHISVTSKRLAKELNLPVVLLSQLNRQVDDRQDHIPRLSDLRESGALEQDADVIIFLCRPCLYIPDQESPEYHAQKHDARVIVAKQRDGWTGMIRCDFMGEYFKFKDRETPGRPQDDRYQ